MDKLLEDRTAIITGANRGIGKSIVENFAINGANIIACVKNKTDEIKNWAIQTQKNFSVSVNVVEMNLSNDKSVNKATKEIFSISKKIDVLVNNAGIANGALFQMTPISILKNTFEINFFNQILFSQGIAKIMIRNKYGSIINLSSISHLMPDPGTLAYGTSKAAFTRASKSMASELGKYNIRVNSISPGVVKTDMYEQMTKNARDKLINSSILKRAAKPEEVANVALFLASHLSDFITGQEINVDGGIF
ncbi:SDR family oxidoreductase [Alphaproteobacteria bacterium]|nr:SDR family oxidoreductase [Alphaproteobacteria bacterium]